MVGLVAWVFVLALVSGLVTTAALSAAGSAGADDVRPWWALPMWLVLFVGLLALGAWLGRD